MSWKKFAVSLAASLVLVGAAATARADEPDGSVTTTDPDDPWIETPKVQRPAKAFPWFVGFGAGVGYPTIEHPEIVVGGIAAPAFTVHGGYTIGDHVNVGFELAAVQLDIGRNAPSELFQLGYSPQAGCEDCAKKPPGADVIATSLVFSTFGARFEYAPFHRDGLFVGGTAGLAFMVGLDPKSGVGFGGRLGYRLRATNVMTLSLEGGIQGQYYGDTTMYMPYGAAVIRPYF